MPLPPQPLDAEEGHSFIKLIDAGSQASGSASANARCGAVQGIRAHFSLHTYLLVCVQCSLLFTWRFLFFSLLEPIFCITFKTSVARVTKYRLWYFYFCAKSSLRCSCVCVCVSLSLTLISFALSFCSLLYLLPDGNELDQRLHPGEDYAPLPQPAPQTAADLDVSSRRERVQHAGAYHL